MRGAAQHIEIGMVSAWACKEEVMRLYVLLTYKVELHLDLSRDPLALFPRIVRLEEDIFFNSGGQRRVIYASSSAVLRTSSRVGWQHIQASDDKFETRLDASPLVPPNDSTF